MSKRAGESATADDEKRPNLNLSNDAIELDSEAIDSDDCVILPSQEASM